MQFKVPKFLERESTIAWGLTFKNLAIMGALFFTLFGLFYVFKGMGLLWAWTILAVITAIVFVVFNFVKIEGQSAFEVFSNAVGFIFNSRIYMWQRKEGIAPIRLADGQAQKQKRKEAVLRIAPKSRLGVLNSKIDISSIISREEFLEELNEDEGEDYIIKNENEKG